MMLRQPLPTSLRLDPPCIICSAPITTSKARLLNLNETAKILMAAVLTKNVKIENAAQSICNHPLRMCSSHSRPAVCSLSALHSLTSENFQYEMMVNVIGARTADEVDRAKVERMLPGLELYKVLRVSRRRFSKLYEIRLISVNSDHYRKQTNSYDSNGFFQNGIEEVLQGLYAKRCSGSCDAREEKSSPREQHVAKGLRKAETF